MNRTIKFRYWDKINKNWTYLFLEKGGVRFLYPNTGGSDENLEYWQQFTGLLDKNGKEIYCGDILGYGKAKSEVRYDEKEAIYCDIFGLRFASLAEESKVIGNIYENPELTKEELK